MSISVIMEIRQKNLTLASQLSGSLKITGTDSDRLATNDFLLVINSNHGPISYSFRYESQLELKLHIFPTCVFNAPPRELPLEFCNGSYKSYN